MWGPLSGALLRFFGHGGEDPLGTITPDQLAIVLKSIEKKYTELKDENERLRERVANQQEEIGRLTRELADQQSSPKVLG